MAIGLRLALIGIGAGAAAAVLFASVLSGSLLAMFLFYLAPLPIMIAALGWSHLVGLLAAFSAALGLAAAFGPLFFPIFLIGIGLPAWWLGYLALLARTEAGALEWYPTGRLVLWAAVFGALIVIIIIPQIGSDVASVQAKLRNAIEAMFRFQYRLPARSPLIIPGFGDVSQQIEFLVLALPPGAAVLIMMAELINLWLAARVTKVSGWLRRPWPDLATMQLPSTLLIMLVAAVAGTLALPDLLGFCSGLFATTLLMAYALLGFAVLHAITQNLQARPLILVAVYTAVLVFGVPILLMTLLGLIDAALNLRARIAAVRGPPAPLS